MGDATGATGIAEPDGWDNSIAHRASIDYWANTYPVGYSGVHTNPPVKDKSFFNAEVSPELCRNGMRIVAGGFFAFHAAGGNSAQPGGISEDEAFNLVVSRLARGECRLSLSGQAPDACYLFSDEQEVS